MNILDAKDLDWSKEHLPAASPESENAEEIINRPKKKASLAKKVSVLAKLQNTQPLNMRFQVLLLQSHSPWN